MRLTVNEQAEMAALLAKDNPTPEEAARFDELTAKRKAPEVDMREALPAIDDNAVNLLLALADHAVHHSQVLGSMAHPTLEAIMRHRAALLADLKK